MGKKVYTRSNFTITNLISDGEGTGGFLIISHKDLDGLISAYLLAVALKGKYRRIDVLFSQPYMAHGVKRFLTEHNRINDYAAYALVDLAIDYSKPKTTRKLMSFLGGSLHYIFDHHTGWNSLIQRINNGSMFNVFIEGECTVNKGSKCQVVLGDVYCCAQLIYDHFNLKGLKNTYIDDLLIIAGISDDLTLRKMYENTSEYAQFISFKNNTLENCLNQIKVCTKTSDIHESTNRYSISMAKAVETIKTAEEIYPGIGYLRTTVDDNLSYTVIYEQAYKYYNIFIIKELDPKKLKIAYTIAHTLPDLNLAELFGLRSGNPRRINLRGKHWTISGIVEKLKPYADNAHSISK